MFQEPSGVPFCNGLYFFYEEDADSGETDHLIWGQPDQVVW